MLKLYIPKEYILKGFKGYIYALQYLWYQLVDKNSFYQTKFDKLTKTLEQFDSSYNLEDKELIEKIDQVWEKIDHYFGLIEEKIIKNLTQKLNYDPVTDDICIIQEKYNKQEIWGPLINPRGLKQPSYLKKNDKKSLFKKLDYYFYWYKVNPLETSSIFNGVPAFISTMIGLSILTPPNEPIEILRFKHPKRPGQNNYSYAILIPAFSSSGIADYSGWLVFFNCATDHSGFGGSMHYLAEYYIKQHKERLNIRTVSIPLHVFGEYLCKKGIYSIPDLYKVEQERTYRAELKGKMFELLVYYYYSQKEQTTKIFWDTKLADKEQIDILLIKDDHAEIIETKLSIGPHQIDRIIKKKERALKLAHKDPTLKNIQNTTFRTIVYKPVKPSIKQELKQKGIKVEDNFQKTIQENPIFKHVDKRKIKNILDDKDVSLFFW